MPPDAEEANLAADARALLCCLLSIDLPTGDMSGLLAHEGVSAPPGPAGDPTPGVVAPALRRGVRPGPLVALARKDPLPPSLVTPDPR